MSQPTNSGPSLYKTLEWAGLGIFGLVVLVGVVSNSGTKPEPTPVETSALAPVEPAPEAPPAPTHNIDKNGFDVMGGDATLALLQTEAKTMGEPACKKIQLVGEVEEKRSVLDGLIQSQTIKCSNGNTYQYTYNALLDPPNREMVLSLN